MSRLYWTPTSAAGLDKHDKVLVCRDLAIDLFIPSGAVRRAYRVETQQWTVSVAVVKRCCPSVPVVNTITRYWFLEDDMEMVSPFGPLAGWGWPLSSNHWYCATRLSAAWETLTDSVAVLPINPQL